MGYNDVQRIQYSKKGVGNQQSTYPQSASMKAKYAESLDSIIFFIKKGVCMGIKESNISKKIQMAMCLTGARLLRNNTGLFLSLDGKRKQRAGLGEGTSDLIGWTPVIITKEMLGKQIAVFTAIEVKTESNNAKEAQSNFITAVKHAGGFAGVAKNEQEAIQISLGL